MSFRRIPLVLIGLAFLAGAGVAAAQEWRTGRARVEGTVKNEKGEPIAGAKVALRWGKDSHEGPDLTTDKRGRWAFMGLAGGPWNIDFEAPGHLTKQISAQLTEAERNPPIDVQLQPQPKAEPAHEEFRVAGQKISKETAEAIEKGNVALAAKNYGQAREEYTKALAEVPDSAALSILIAAAYYGEGNSDEAVKYARQVTEKDPQDANAWRMIAEIELQRGNLDAGRAALSKVPEEKIKDAQPYLNIGILLLNKKKPAEAELALNKAIGIQPDLADAYYMRGLARMQLKKQAEAKADLQKYLELAPNGSEAKDVREILKSLS